jgi:3-oxoacyl-[acyl-carrier-protein] synthase-1
MIDAAGDELICGRDALLDAALQGPRRLAALAEYALLDLVAALTERGSFRGTLPVILAVPESRPGFRRQEIEILRRELEAIRPPNVPGLRVEVIDQGHAGGFRALETAAQQITSGQAEVCVVGGVDSYLDARTIDWLQVRLRIMVSGVRSGFYPGEGAAFVALASDRSAAMLGLPPLAHVRHVACGHESRTRSSAEGLLGEGLTQAIVTTTSALRREETVHEIYCDINGERWRTDDWGFAALRTATRFRDPTEYRMSAGQIGDVGAASAALNYVLAIRAWSRGYARGSNALVWGASWRGLRGAALLEQGGR